MDDTIEYRNLHSQARCEQPERGIVPEPNPVATARAMITATPFIFRYNSHMSSFEVCDLIQYYRKIGW